MRNELPLQAMYNKKVSTKPWSGISAEAFLRAALWFGYAAHPACPNRDQSKPGDGIKVLAAAAYVRAGAYVLSRGLAW
jgi:hypothetical protein